jgi:very-short-patch-repair endonuclease
VGVHWNQPLLVGGARRIADACWPMVWLIVEVDSVEHHGLGWTPEATSRRRAELVAAGWTVLSVSPYRIRHDGPALLDQLERTHRHLAKIHGV